MTVRCRTCGELVYNLNAKKLFNGDGTLQKIEALTGIWLTDEWDMPEYICACCLVDLNHAISFRERCLKTHRLLLTAKLEAAQGNPLLEGNVSVDPLNGMVIQDEDYDIVENDDSFVVANEDIEDEAIDYIQASSEVNDDSDAANDVDSSANVKNFPEPEKQKVRKVRVVLANLKTSSRRAALTLTAGLAQDSNISTISKTTFTTSTSTKADRLTPRVAHSQPSASDSDYSCVSGKAAIKRNQKYYPPRNNLVCDQCGKIFKDVSNFNVHMVHHRGVKEYECPQCDNKYYQAYHLNLHIRVRHKGEEPFACHLCDERFRSSPARQRHLRKAHAKPGTEASKTRSHICTYCGKAFLTKPDLKKHEFVHTGLRAYQCETCKVSFKRSTHLRTHYRSQQHQKMMSQVAQVINDPNDDIDFDFNDSIIDEFE